MTARSQARAGDAAYANPQRAFRIGDKVSSNGQLGRITHIAFSQSMDAPVYTVAFNTRISLRLVARDIELVEES